MQEFDMIRESMVECNAKHTNVDYQPSNSQHVIPSFNNVQKLRMLQSDNMI